MFGGLAFLLQGHMACGVVGDDLVVRVGPDAYAAALRRRHARPMDFTGRPLTGFVYVGSDGTRAARALHDWLERGVAFAGRLPSKKAGRSKRR